MSIRKGTDILAYGKLQVEALQRDMGEIVYSSVPLSNESYHLADGSVLTSTDYPEFISYMASLYNSSDKYSNVNIVGSLTDNNGVLSGFSTNNYATLPSTISLGSSFEIGIKVTTGNDVTTNNNLFNRNGTAPDGLNFRIIDGQLSVFISSNGTTFDIASDVRSTLTFNTNTTYYIRVTYNGSNYLFDVSEDNETWINYIDISSPNSPHIYTPIIGEYGGGGNPWLGSIDLNECYIDIDGSRFWTGRQTVGFVDEGQWQSYVSSSITGSCGKYVYDPINNTLRIPKYNGIQEGTVLPATIGNLIKAGLPTANSVLAGAHTHSASTGSESAHTHTRGTMEIKGSFQGGKSGSAVSGAFTKASGADCYTTGTADSYTMSFTASKNWTGSTSAGTSHNHTATINSGGGHVHTTFWGSSLQETNTVQPETTKVLVYIVVKAITKSLALTNINNITSDLNQKADMDLSNVVLAQGAKHLIGRLSFPSDHYVDITLGSSGDEYTAPADGFFSCAITGTAGSTYMQLASYDGGNHSKPMAFATASFCGGWGAAFVPVKAGDAVVSYYGGTNFTLQFFRFVYAESEE